MKKTLFFLSAIVFTISNPLKSTAQVFEEGKVYISAGYGFPNVSASIFRTFEDNEDFTIKGLGPIHGKVEYALTDIIGLGVSVNYVSTEVRWDDGNNGQNGYDYSALAANLRVNFHFLDRDDLDLYYGFGFGYNSADNKFFTSGNNTDIEDINFPSFHLGFETTMGLRYMFTYNVGAYFELGWAKSLMQGGLVFKL